MCALNVGPFAGRQIWPYGVSAMLERVGCRQHGVVCSVCGSSSSPAVTAEQFGSRLKTRLLATRWHSHRAWFCACAICFRNALNAESAPTA